jgi:hypothetical protein
LSDEAFTPVLLCEELEVLRSCELPERLLEIVRLCELLERLPDEELLERLLEELLL